MITMLIQKVAVFVLGITCWLSTGSYAAGPQPVSSSSLTIEGIPKHPAMALTPAAIELGRRNCRESGWAREIGDGITSAADVWLKRDEQWIVRHMPPQRAAFAYGFAGCPKCGGKTAYSTNWASANCSFDNPGHVQCENGHVLPNEKYPDPGSGYRGTDGRMHYFAGIYNAWAVEHFILGAYDLAYAYSLTGNEQYAARSAQILDAVADIYPTCTVGSWDYPETRPGQNHGRLNRPQYQVGRVLVNLANAYDQIFNVKALDEASVRHGLSRRENIEKNMLQDGAWYCYNQSFNFNGLTNGEADYIKGAMVVGVVLGIPEYVTWAVDGPYGIRSMLANNIGRDGTYYETATGYSNYTRTIYRGYAEYLLNYRGSAYPDGINLYEDQRFRDFMLLLNLKTQIGGAIPTYGDAAPTVASFESRETPFDRFDFECLEYLRARANDPAEKQQYAELLAWMSHSAPEAYYKSSPSARWLLFHAEPLPRQISSNLSGGKYAAMVQHSDVLGQKGMVMLRTGSGKNAQGVLMRYGPSLNHANFDELNFTYHALGRDLTYDLGYGLGSAHVFAGWSKQTASHQLVVVDETSQGTGGAPSGGSLRSMWQGSYTSAVEASSPDTYRAAGVDKYARTMFLVSDSETTASYLVDIFRVSGGKQHDAFTHSLGTEVEFGNAALGELTSTSVAGDGMEWGDKVLVDGDIAGHPNKPYWVAPPGNGYGFLMEPQSITPEHRCWWADWHLPDGPQRVRTWFVDSDDEHSVTAWAPGILKHFPDARYVVRRREPADGGSVFVTVWEPYERVSRIASIDQYVVKNGSNWPTVGVTVQLKNGGTDVLFSEPNRGTTTIENVKVSGKLFRFSRRNGVISVAEGIGVSELQMDGDETSLTVPSAYVGSVVSVYAQKGTFKTEDVLPSDGSMNGLIINFSSPGYSRSTAYKIQSVEKSGSVYLIRLTENCVLGGGVVEAVTEESESITSVVGHEYIKPVHRQGDSEFFKGKRIAATGGADARIIKAGYKQPLVLNLDSTEGFRPGDEFVYEDVQVGDRFEVLMPVRVK